MWVCFFHDIPLAAVTPHSSVGHFVQILWSVLIELGFDIETTTLVNEAVYPELAKFAVFAQPIWAVYSDFAKFAELLI